jgi:peptidoglycan/xylan/chitin deacetylase (PgdA/CDA1 family)
VTAVTGPSAPFRVALTFDVEHHDRRATADATETLLGLLSRFELRATCFIQGRWAEAYPGVAGSIAAAGHLVGNHSYYHARMPLLTDAGLSEDLTEAGRVITETTGADPRPWFRCPFGAGAHDPRVQAAVRAAGYRHVGWHVGVEDWDPAKSAATIERDVVEGTLAHGDGAVVLLHAWPTATREAIGAIAGRLRDAGATFVTVDALGEVPGTVT